MEIWIPYLIAIVMFTGTEFFIFLQLILSYPFSPDGIPQLGLELRFDPVRTSIFDYSNGISSQKKLAVLGRRRKAKPRNSLALDVRESHQRILKEASEMMYVQICALSGSTPNQCRLFAMHSTFVMLRRARSSHLLTDAIGAFVPELQPLALQLSSSNL